MGGTNSTQSNSSSVDVQEDDWTTEDYNGYDYTYYYDGVNGTNGSYAMPEDPFTEEFR